MSLKGRVAWVTGGGRGIGRSCALALAKEFCAIGLTARSGSELAATAKECDRLAVKSFEAPADVTDPVALKKAYDGVRESLGEPDILVNSAGLARSAPFLKTTEKFMDELWRLNVMGTFHATQLAMPAMLEKKWGRVVNVASVAGKVGAAYVSAYTASKHGVVGLTRSLAVEFATKGVTVNAVCPGYVDTKMTHENVDIIVQKTGRSREEAFEHMRSRSPQGRLTTPEEVASVVAFLCSEEASNINGQAINVDGGAVHW